jgi:hypothetical protein
MRFPLFLILLVSGALFAQDFRCDAGLRFQKTWELYWENGVEGSCSKQNILGGHPFLSASAVSSRLGSALGSNALRQEEYLLGLGWKFRTEKRIQPYIALQTGWFWLDVEEPMFEVLPHSSVLATFSFGSEIPVYGPFLTRIGMDYHLITGDGLQGPGSLYPLFMHTSFLVRIP